MNPHLLSFGLLRQVGALALADMSASGKAATCRRSPNPKEFISRTWCLGLRLLSLLLLLTGGLPAQYSPPLFKMMEKADIFGEEPFEGNLAITVPFGLAVAFQQAGQIVKCVSWPLSRISRP